MNVLVAFCKSSIGKKIIVAITGIALVGFVLAHMLGNLQIYLGPEQLNAYAHKLQSLGPLLWAARIGLLAIFVIHIAATISLARQNRAARPQRYAAETSVRCSFASRTMVLSGLIVACFVIYHILHLTVRVTDPAITQYLATPASRVDGNLNLYGMMILTFQNPWISGFYILGMVLLYMHLSHGVGSLFQTIGIRNVKTRNSIQTFSLVFAALIFIGNCSIPLSIWLGFIKL